MSLKLLLVDYDGLRADVFSEALTNEAIPHIARLLGGQKLANCLVIPALAPAPSITFASQASIFTGVHPSQHGIPGNQYFDRFGTHNSGRPRHYAFDVGDTLAGDDAVKVFTKGLASNILEVPTIYERFGDLGWKSVVAGNMYAKGADTWIKPSLVNLARFTTGKNIFGMDSADFDRRMLESTINSLYDEGLPDVLTLYFMGLDHESHLNGPEAQIKYLVGVIDPMIGELLDGIRFNDPNVKPITAVFSDHGQIRVVPDDKHSLRLAFPFEREMGYLFDALGLDVHDYPGEDPHCNAVVCSNGGLAFVYLRNQRSDWSDVPDFHRNVLPVAKAFWDAHLTGKYAPELEGALAGVLLRDVNTHGWYAPYHVFTRDFEMVSLDTWFSPGPPSRTRHRYSDPIYRIKALCSPLVGDLLLISNYADGYYFGTPLLGVHGGLHPEDSMATMALGFPGKDQNSSQGMKAAVSHALQKRCQEEGGRKPTTADLLTCLLPILEID